MDKVVVGLVNCELAQPVCDQYEVTGFPTLKLFHGHAAYEEYNGSRELNALVAFVMDWIDNVNTNRSPHDHSYYHHRRMKINIFGRPASSATLFPILIIISSFIVGMLSSFYILCLQPRQKVKPPPIYAHPDSSTVKPGHGAVYRVGGSGESYSSFPKAHVNTMLESFQRSVRSNPTGHCLGHRPIIDAKNGHVGAYVWETYEQVYLRVQNLAGGLIHENMLCEPSIVQKDKKDSSNGEKMLLIFMKNRPEWVVAQYAAFYGGAAVSCLYDTLGARATSYILQQTKVQTVVCTSADLKQLLAVKPNVPSLKHVVLVDLVIKPVGDVEEAMTLGLTVWTMAELEMIGMNHPVAPTYAKPNDMCFLMYVRLNIVLTSS